MAPSERWRFGGVLLGKENYADLPAGWLLRNRILFHPTISVLKGDASQAILKGARRRSVSARVGEVWEDPMQLDRSSLRNACKPRRWAAVAAFAVLTPAVVGACDKDESDSPEDEAPCDIGLYPCGDACVNLKDDEANCGACGAQCLSDEVCLNGRCGCSQAGTRCEGVCISLTTDPRNCGSCGNVCERGLVCLQGVCSEDCGTLVECDGGCVDLATDPNHCGACGRTCATGEECIGRVCICPEGEICGGGGGAGGGPNPSTGGSAGIGGEITGGSGNGGVAGAEPTGAVGPGGIDAGGMAGALTAGGPAAGAAGVLTAGAPAAGAPNGGAGGEVPTAGAAGTPPSGGGSTPGGAPPVTNGGEAGRGRGGASGAG